MKGFLATITLISCFIQYPYASACNDSLYLELKKKDINSLTKNEVTFLIAADSLCDNEKKNIEIKKAERQKEIQDSISTEKKHKEIGTKVALTIFAVSMGILTLIVIPIGIGIKY
ncbi:MAG TPA: hypothetical protein VLX68_17175 [Chitinivibrionales bacterium]|nr:hypothetical protein [Chitinivibrionales bacterium]